MHKIRIKVISSNTEYAASISEHLSKEAKKLGIEIVDSDFEYVAAIGGDGTLIKTVNEGKPIIAISAGKRNGLLDVHPEDIDRMLVMLLKGKFKRVEYDLISVDFNGMHMIAFNELAINSLQPQSIVIRLAGIGKTLDIEGDGVLISTQQGSSGWSLSANNTILDQGVKAFAITALNPVLSPIREIIVPQKQFSLEMIDRGYSLYANLSIDGRNITRLQPKDKIRFKKSQKKAVILRFFEHDTWAPIRVK